jgi:hypothetical protein
MRLAHLRPLSVLLFCTLTWTLCARSRAQNVPSTLDSRAIVKPDPKRAKKLLELGEKQEAEGSLLDALRAFEEAAHYAPFDVNIVSKGAALRSKLVRSYVDNAERLALQSELDGATEQLAGALQIDPGNTIVLERLQQMESMRDENKNRLPEEPAQGLTRVFPDRVTRSFHLQMELRGAYEEVAAAYGIKASFDPDLPSRVVKLWLDNVDFQTALTVLSAESGTFWRPLSPTLIFVAADTPEKRKQFDQEVEQTFALPASVTTTEMTDLVRALRELTGVQHIQQSIPAHTITIRDIVSRVHLAGAMIQQLEQAPGEVLLEIDFLEVDRTNAMKLGITPPSKISLIPVGPSLANQLKTAPSLTALLTLLASVFGGPLGAAAAGGLGSLASAIPPVAAIGGGKTLFLLTLPTASADFSQSLSLVHSGRQLLMRAQDGKPATFFVGDRYPVTLSLLSGSLGSTGFAANPGGMGITIPSEQFSVGEGPVALVVADFRNIGEQDLGVLNEIDNTVTILLNQGTGAATQFAQATNSPISLGNARTQAPPVPAAMAVGNLNPNTDSFPDLLVTDPVANTVTVLLANSAANGAFTIQPNPIAVGNEPSAVAVGAFNTNTNSNLGFVVTNFADNSYSVFTGNGDGTFAQVTGSPFALPAGETGPYAITVADFNDDGRPDLAIVNQTSKSVTVLEGNGDGTFTEFQKSPLPTGNVAVAIASGSLAGSTGPALAVVNQKDNTVSVYLGNGDGTFVQASQSPLATSNTPGGVAIAAFAQQSSGGIAVTNTASGTVTVFLDLGNGLFTKALEPAAGTNPGAIGAGDFANNTFPDIVVANNLSGTPGLVTLLVSPTSVISNPAIAQQPYPGSEYIDIGLKVKATPTLHDDNEVTLQLEFEIKALSGSNENGIPIISNRSVTQAVRLKEDETSLVTGLLNREETKTITGLPGFAKLPVAGYLFGVRDNSFTNDELLILVTPRRVRAPIRDSRTLYAGRGDTSGRAGAGPGVAPVAPVPEPGPPAPTGERPPAEPTPGQPPPAPAPPQVPPPAQPAPEGPPQENQPPAQAPPQPQPQP